MSQEIGKTIQFFIFAVVVVALGVIVIRHVGSVATEIETERANTSTNILSDNGTVVLLAESPLDIINATTNNQSWLYFDKNIEDWQASETPGNGDPAYVRLQHAASNTAEPQDLLNATQLTFSIWLNSSVDLNRSIFTPSAYYSYPLFKPQNTFRFAWAGFSVDGWEVTAWNRSDTGGLSECKVQARNAHINKNEWNHFAGTYNGSTLSFYINGIINSTNSTCPPNFLFDKFGAAQYFDTFIGTKNQNLWENLTWNGSIDEVRVYNLSLSANDISRIYSAGRMANTSINSSGLIYWFSFNEGSGSVAIDKLKYRNGTEQEVDYHIDGRNRFLADNDFSVIGQNFSIINADYAFDTISFNYGYNDINTNIDGSITRLIAAIVALILVVYFFFYLKGKLEEYNE